MLFSQPDLEAMLDRDLSKTGNITFYKGYEAVSARQDDARAALTIVDFDRETTKHDIPDAAQWCNPRRPTTIVPCGINRRHREFMRAAGETVEEFTTDENVWRMISQWIKPDEGVLVRKAVDNFRSLVAEK